MLTEDWKTINSAPSRTVVLVYVHPDVEIAMNTLTNGWVICNVTGWAAEIEPTHWMPLPGPPDEFKGPY